MNLAHYLLPDDVGVPSVRQRLFMLFFAGTLIDLVVLLLFAEYSGHVYVASFSIALLAAVVMQALLKLAIILEERVLGRFEGKTGAYWKTAKFTVAWVVLLGSKFAILYALAFIFGRNLRFEGIIEGALWLIAVALTMIAAEQLAGRLYRSLA